MYVTLCCRYKIQTEKNVPLEFGKLMKVCRHVIFNQVMRGKEGSLT